MGLEELRALHDKLKITKTPTVGREEYLDYLTFERNDRPLFDEIFGPLLGLKEEWAAQGARPEEIDMSAFTYRFCQKYTLPVRLGYLQPHDERIIRQNDEEIVAIDGYGRTVRLCTDTATLALPLDYPVETMDDWQKIKHQYAFDESRLDTDWRQAYQQARKDDCVIGVGMPGGFDEPRQLMGEENLCIAYYEQPELVHDILDTIGAMLEQVYDRISQEVQVDMLYVHEDMAGKSGSLAGPNQIAEFIKPYYRRIWDMLQGRGTRLFLQDSDGDMRGVMDAFIDAGLNFMHPCEPAAGMDVVELRKQYGTKMAFEGGIDKHVLRRSKDEIVAELEYKLPPMIASGGYVIALDHRIPNGTPIDHYRFYHDKVWEIIRREAS